MKPSAPMMIKAISQPQARASRGMVAGAASAPTEAPLLKIEVEKARSFFGKYSAVALMAAGKLPASPTARIRRQARKSHTEMVVRAVMLPPARPKAVHPQAACRQAPTDHTKMAMR